AMLGTHSHIYAIPVETDVFRRGLSPEQIRQQLEQRSKECRKPSVRYVCEKTPRHVFKYNAISALYPDAKFVFMTRNPRDVVASLKRRGHSVDAAINRWRVDNEAVIRRVRNFRAHLVIFEHLVGNPEATLSPVCKFLDLDYEKGMLDYWKDERDWFGAKE